MITKKTFAESLEERRVEKNNSDLHNLASAYEKGHASIRYLEEQIGKVRELQEKIKETASNIEKGDVLPIEDIRSLYDHKLFRLVNL